MLVSGAMEALIRSPQNGNTRSNRADVEVKQDKTFLRLKVLQTDPFNALVSFWKVIKRSERPQPSRSRSARTLLSPFGREE
jgi:hypothetical protein